jgi:hypothetical protein
MTAASQAPLAITGTHHLGLTVRDLGGQRSLVPAGFWGHAPDAGDAPGWAGGDS